MPNYWCHRAGGWRWRPDDPVPSDRPLDAVSARLLQAMVSSSEAWTPPPRQQPSPKFLSGTKPMTDKEVAAAAEWLGARPRLSPDTYARGMPEDLEAYGRQRAEVDRIEFIWLAADLFDRDLPPVDTMARYRQEQAPELELAPEPAPLVEPTRTFYRVAVRQPGCDTPEVEVVFDTLPEATTWLAARMAEDGERQPSLATFQEEGELG